MSKSAQRSVSDMSKLNQCKIFELRVSDINPQFLIKFLQKAVVNDKNKPLHIITLNPEMVVESRKNKKFKNIIKNAGLIIPDGIGIVWAARILQNKKLSRFSGTDIAKIILDGPKGTKAFLFGGQPGVAERIEEKWGSSVAGIFPGYGADDKKVIEKINNTNANILLVGLGSPKQEIWINENLSKLKHIKVAIGVGGAFDFLSGETKRAPRWIRKIGLEWLWRLILDPKRAKRIFRATVVFPWLVLKEKLKTS